PSGQAPTICRWMVAISAAGARIVTTSPASSTVSPCGISVWWSGSIVISSTPRGKSSARTAWPTAGASGEARGYDGGAHARRLHPGESAHRRDQLHQAQSQHHHFYLSTFNPMPSCHTPFVIDVSADLPIIVPSWWDTST